MNPNEVSRALDQVNYWAGYGLAWAKWYFQVIYFCLFTGEGWSRIGEWPWFVWVTLLVAVLLVVLAVDRLANPSPPYRGRHIRGPRLVVQRDYWLRWWFRWNKGALFLGRVRWPQKLESLHLLVTGSTSAGKSQAINGLMTPLRLRGDLAIVTDSGGEAMSRYIQDGDVILNPLDKRAQPWSPFAEMDHPADADRLSKSMIPDQEHKEGEWITYSQRLVSAVLQRLWERDQATNGAMLHYLTAAPSDELLNLVQGLPAQGLFGSGNERMLGSVRGIVSTYLAPYAHLPADAGRKSFSIRRHVQAGTGWLWLPHMEKQSATLRPLIAAWLGEAVNALLSMPPDLARRRWLLLDEVASLGCVQGLSDALTKGRKHGLCAVLGLQSVSQLRSAYGDDGAQTLLSCLSSQLFLRAADPETARYASGHLGQCELERASVTQGGKQGPTRTRTRHTEDLVLASEFQGLPDRRGYLRLAGQSRVYVVTVPRVQHKAYFAPFVPRPLAPPSAPAPTPAQPNPPRRPLLDADAILKADE